MARVMAISNQKGGVGKTTTAVNLAAALVYEKKNVLVIDLDPQGNATTSLGLGLKRKELEYSSYDVLVNEIPIKKAIFDTSVKNVSIVAGTIDLSSVELKLTERLEREYVLHKAVRDVLDDYDYILIDCPPSLGLITINAMMASNSVIIPVQCEFFAIEGLTQLLNTLRVMQKKQKENGRLLDIEGILLTMLDNRSNFGYEIVQEVKKYFNEKVFKTIIPRNIQAQIAPSHGLPVVEYAKTASSARMYRKLAKEIVSKYV